jgi:hypothetical protein
MPVVKALARQALPAIAYAYIYIIISEADRIPVRTYLSVMVKFIAYQKGIYVDADGTV